MAVQTIAKDDLIAAYARAKQVDVTTAGKLVRSRLRANFEVIAKADPSAYGKRGKVKNVANDRRPWGPIPAKAVGSIFPTLTFKAKRTRTPKAKVTANVPTPSAPVEQATA